MALIATPLYLGLGVAMAALLAASMVFVRRRFSPEWAFVLISTAVIELMFVFTAGAGVGYGRYTVTLWPMMVLATAFACVGASWPTRASLRLVSVFTGKQNA